MWLWVEDHYVPSTVDSCSGGVVVFNTDYGQVSGGGGVCITQEQWLNICSVHLRSNALLNRCHALILHKHTLLCVPACLEETSRLLVVMEPGTRYTEMTRNSVKPVSQLGTVCLCFNVHFLSLFLIF